MSTWSGPSIADIRHLLGACTFAAVLAFLVSACSGDICDSDDLKTALVLARPGDEVQLGACTLEGSFAVPSGVGVRGRGADLTRVIGTEGLPAITLVGGEESSSLSHFTVVADAPGAVLVDGGAASLADIAIEPAADAYGVFAADARHLSVMRVDVRGPLTSEDWFDAVSSSWARLGEGRGVGVVVARTPGVHVEELNTRGLVLAALFVDSDTTWNGGLIEKTFRGLVVAGGTTDLSALRVTDFVQADQPDLTGAAIVTLDDVVDAWIHDVDVEGRAPYAGLALVGSSAQMTNVSITGAQRTGLDISNAADVVLESSSIEGGRAAGVRIRRSANVEIRGVQVAHVGMASLEIGRTPYLVGVADGVLIAQSTGVNLHSVQLVDNERVGIRVEACEDPATMPTFVNVTATGVGSQRGAYASVLATDGGTRVAPMGWDEGIVREGATLANDASNAPLADTEINPCPGG